MFFVLLVPILPHHILQIFRTRYSQASVLFVGRLAFVEYAIGIGSACNNFRQPFCNQDLDRTMAASSRLASECRDKFNITSDNNRGPYFGLKESRWIFEKLFQFRKIFQRMRIMFCWRQWNGTALLSFSRKRVINKRNSSRVEERVWTKSYCCQDRSSFHESLSISTHCTIIEISSKGFCRQWFFQGKTLFHFSCSCSDLGTAYWYISLRRQLYMYIVYSITKMRSPCAD